MPPRSVYSFFFNDTATTEIYTLSLHDALPISGEFEEHFRQLYSPGVPFPFECIHAVRVGDVRFVTERLRLAFADQRRSEEHTSNSSHANISYAVFCLKKKNRIKTTATVWTRHT